MTATLLLLVTLGSTGGAPIRLAQADLEPPPQSELPAPQPPPLVDGPEAKLKPMPRGVSLVEAAEAEAEKGRFARIGLGLLLSLPGVAAVSGVLLGATAHVSSLTNAPADQLGFGVLWTLAGVAASVLVPVGAWGGMKLAGGRAHIGWAFAGWAVGFVGAAVCLAIGGVVKGNVRYPFYVLGGLFGVAGPLVALELRHDAVVIDEVEKQEWSFGVMPLDGGAMVALGRRF